MIFLHSFHVAYGTQEGGLRSGFLNPGFVAILPIFFGLSGFLVAGSAVRTSSVATFLGFRAIRLVPALAVEVTLAALLLGPVLTTVPLTTYFSGHEFLTYWGNIIGRVRYFLPGLFTDNPVPRTVNMNLWTLHAELECYAIMALAMLLGLMKRRKLMLTLWVVASIIMLGLSVASGWFVRAPLYPPSMFVYAFCTGVVAFLWRDHLPIAKSMLFVSIIAYLVTYFIKPIGILGVLPLIYIMIWVGMQPRLNARIFRKGDYSYGLYLYGFVIQQTIVYLLPEWRAWWFVFPSSLLITLLFAIFSWHVVEKPALRLKKMISSRSAVPPGEPGAHQQAPRELDRLDAAL